MEKKRPLGFKTPGMRIEEEYEEILKQIMGKKADWEKVLQDCIKMFKFTSDGAEDILKKTTPKERTHEYLMELEHRILIMGQCMTQTLVARIGKELAESNVRISEVEKELKELQRGLK